MSRVFGAVVCAWLLLLAAGAAPPPAQRLLPVSLPDLSKASRSVQEQLRAAHEAMTARTSDAALADADRANAYGDMGRLFMAAEFRDLAERSFLNAQTIAPADPRWPYYLGHLYKAEGDVVRATASFERALQLKPDDVATLVWLGVAYLDRNESEAAEARFTQAQLIEPNLVAAIVGLGRVALARRQYDVAVEQLARALSLDPRASSVHYPLALAYRGLGQMEQAELHLRQRGGVETGPPDPLMRELDGLLESAMAYQSRGIRALERGQPAAAAAFFRRATELEPGNASLRQRLGSALYLTGDAAGAVAQFEGALRLSPEFARAHYSLGVVLASRGRYRAAAERFAAAVKYESDNVEARRALATLK